MQRTLAIGLAALLLSGSALGCCSLPPLPKIEMPDININVPTVEIGELRDETRAIPLDGAETAAVDVRFGGGELVLSSGADDQLFSGRFIYNVEPWTPDVTFEDERLTVEQGGDEDAWGFPSGNVGDIRNEWTLEFTPQIPLAMDLKMGAGKGTLDFSGLQITELDIDMGAGDFEVRFDEPNQAEMRRLTLDAGASKLRVQGIGNAGPEHVTVQGGAGDITLDFTGDWPDSADIDITAGVGTLALRLPDDVGVEVDIEGGLSDIEAPDFTEQPQGYVNDAYETAERQLHIEVKLGIGRVSLIEVSD